MEKQLPDKHELHDILLQSFEILPQLFLRNCNSHFTPSLATISVLDLSPPSEPSPSVARLEFVIQRKW